VSQRISIDFSDSAFETLEVLQEHGGHADAAGAIRAALAVYKWFLETRESAEILVKDRDGHIQHVILEGG